MLHRKHWHSIALWTLLGLLPQAHADQGSAISMLTGVEQYRWREFDTDKRQLLEESGQRYSVAANYDNLRRLNSGGLYSVGGKFYLGSVDYDGETQLTSIPVQSTTTYVGIQVDAVGGYRFASHMQGLDLFAGGGLDFWTRSIDDSYAPGLGPVYGGDEDYYTVFSKIGMGYFHQMGKVSQYLQAGVKYPVYVYEYAYQTNADNLTLHPKGRASFFARYRWEFGNTGRVHWGATLYFDSYRFSQSNLVLDTANGVPTGYVVWQPESHQDVYGLQIGLYFR
jgi:hypothetical protein